jgi:hypothetical protein
MRRFVILSVVALLFSPALAHAQFQQGDWELTLSGSGNNDQDFRTYSWNVSGTLGYFLTKELEVGVRQGLTQSDGGSAWGGDTRGAVDWHFDLGRWVPFVGANIGYEYGDTVDDAWIAGPEAGIKFFANSTTFIQANISYEFDLNNGLDSGSFFYGLGVGFRF